MQNVRVPHRAPGSGKTDQLQLMPVRPLNRFGGGGGHGNQTTSTPAQGFLNHFIARTAADQHESVARMSIPVKQRPDEFVQGIVPPDVFAQQHHLTLPIHPRRGVGRPCLSAQDLQPFKPRQHRVQQPDV